VNVLMGDRYIDRGATEAARFSTGHLGRQSQASIVHRIFPGREGALPAMLGEIGFRAPWEVFLPCRLEAARA
jgi:hypothetical protein